MSKENEKNSFWQIIRGICIICVVLIHCASISGDASRGEWIYYTVIRNLINFPVPMFFFISGYFTNREKIGGGYILSRCKRLAFPYIIWTVIYIGIQWILGIPLSVKGVVRSVIMGASSQFYYVEVLLLFTLLLPLLIKLASKRRCYIVGMITVLALVVAYALQIYGINIWRYMKYTPVWAIFYIWGLAKADKKFQRSNISIVSLISMCIVCFMVELLETWILGFNPGSSTMIFSQMKLSGIIYSISLIELVFYLSQTVTVNGSYSGKIWKGLCYIGDQSFAVYWIHYIFIWLFERGIKTYNINLSLPVVRLSEFIFVLLCSIMTTVVLKMIVRNKRFQAFWGV